MEQEKDEPLYPRGIGGWLLLLAFNLFAGLAILLTALFSELLPVLESDEFTTLTDPASEFFIPYARELIIAEVAVEVVSVVALTALFVMLFSKHRLFPRLCIIWIVARLFVTIADNAATDMVFHDYVEGSTFITAGSELVRTAVFAIGTVAYLLTSRRVKNTFLRNINSDDEQRGYDDEERHPTSPIKTL